MRCAICEAPSEALLCSSDCRRTLKERVHTEARRRAPHLYDAPPLVLDPAVGDERAIARASLEMRIADEITRPERLRRAAESAHRMGLPEWIGCDAVTLAERESGMNCVRIEVRGMYLTVFESGDFECNNRPGPVWWLLDEEKSRWIEVCDDWQGGPAHRVISSPVQPPQYGDAGGVNAVSVVEHGHMLDLNSPCFPSFREMVEPSPDPEAVRMASEAIRRVRDMLEAEKRKNRTYWEEFIAQNNLLYAGMIICAQEYFQEHERRSPSGLDRWPSDAGRYALGVCTITGEPMAILQYGNASITWCTARTREGLYEREWQNLVQGEFQKCGSHTLASARAGWHVLVGARFYRNCYGGEFAVWASEHMRGEFLPALRRCIVRARPRYWCGFDLEKARILGDELGIPVTEHPEEHGVFLLEVS